MSLFRAALFDLDGVVFNTEPQYTLFWGSQFREFYPDSVGLEYKVKGQTLVQIFDTYYSGNLLEKREIISSRLHSYERDMDYPYIEGFVSFTNLLKRHGISMAIVTSSDLPKMEAVYNKCPDLRELVPIILTSEDFEHSKPAPDCYLKAASRLGVAVDECIVFEDSFNGLRSGRAASMATIGLSTTNTPESLSPFADMVVPDFTSLTTDLCNKLLNK